MISGNASQKMAFYNVNSLFEPLVIFKWTHFFSFTKWTRKSEFAENSLFAEEFTKLQVWCNHMNLKEKPKQKNSWQENTGKQLKFFKDLNQVPVEWNSFLHVFSWRFLIISIGRHLPVIKARNSTNLNTLIKYRNISLTVDFLFLSLSQCLLVVDIAKRNSYFSVRSWMP